MTGDERADATLHLRQLEAAQDRSPSRWSWRRRCKNAVGAAARRRGGGGAGASRRCTRWPSGSKDRPVALAAQDCFWEDQGAFTGEVSAQLLKDVGCKYVIVGHSERRQLFGEIDAAVNLKARAALRAGLDADRLRRRDAGRARRGRDLRPRQRASSTAALRRHLTTRTLRAARDRLRAGVGDRHRPQRDAGAGARGARVHSRASLRERCGDVGRRRCASCTAAASSRTTPRR